MDLTGTWILRAYEVIARDGTVTRPFGDAPLGQIMYGADGTMAAVLGAPNRSTFGGRADHATDAQWGQATRAFAAYAGTWARADDVVRHHVLVALNPDWIGTTLQRTIGVRDSLLTLTVEPRNAAGRAQCLVWGRAG